MKQEELFPEIALEPGSPFVGKIVGRVIEVGLPEYCKESNTDYSKMGRVLNFIFPDKKPRIRWDNYFERGVHDKVVPISRYTPPRTHEENEPINDI